LQRIFSHNIDTLNYFAENIKFLRKLRKLSQDEIATITGITRATWHNYENGNTQPEIDKIIKIAKEFKVNVGDLLETELDKKANQQLNLQQPDIISMVNEDDTLQKNMKDEVNLLILRQLNTLVSDITLIKQKLGL
jgi:transcriptional regulator with XRE-family HTH domain